MPSFEIPDGPTNVALKTGTAGGKPTRTGTATYSVTNKSAVGLSGRLSVQVAGEAKADWFQIEGEKERQFAPGETQTLTVNINVPPEVKPGQYKFRPRVVAVNDPDNDHTDGPVGTVQVARTAAPVAPGGKGGMNIWLIVGIIAAVVVIGGGILAFVLWPRPGGVQIADYAGRPVAEAEAELSELGLSVQQQPVEQADVAPGTVVAQQPPANEKVAEGGVVTLSVAAAPAGVTFALPDVTGRLYENARGVLSANGFETVQRAAGSPDGRAPETVIAQDPAAGVAIAKTAPVKLTVDPGVPVPNFENRSLQSAINAAANKVNLSVSQRCQSGQLDVIIDQSAPAGSVVAKNTPVTVYVRRNPPPGGHCLRLTDRLPLAGRSAADISAALKNN